MKSLRILTPIALILLFAPALSAADFGVRAGRTNNSDREFVGIEVVIGLGAIKLNPNIEYHIDDDDVTAGSANLDITVDVISIASFRPYVGAGVGLSYFDSDLGPNQTDIVGNLIGGVAIDLGSLTPYGQVKYFRRLENEEGDNDDISFAVGLRF